MYIDHKPCKVVAPKDLAEVTPYGITLEHNQTISLYRKNRDTGAFYPPCSFFKPDLHDLEHVILYITDKPTNTITIQEIRVNPMVTDIDTSDLLGCGC
jgi:hypothetical protein